MRSPRVMLPTEYTLLLWSKNEIAHNRATSYAWPNSSCMKSFNVANDDNPAVDVDSGNLSGFTGTHNSSLTTTISVRS